MVLALRNKQTFRDRSQNSRFAPERGIICIDLSPDIEQRSLEEAADGLLRWVFCNGKRLRGLVLRRTDERALFLA